MNSNSGNGLNLISCLSSEALEDPREADTSHTSQNSQFSVAQEEPSEAGQSQHSVSSPVQEEPEDGDTSQHSEFSSVQEELGDAGTSQHAVPSPVQQEIRDVVPSHHSQTFLAQAPREADLSQNSQAKSVKKRPELAHPDYMPYVPVTTNMFILSEDLLGASFEEHAGIAVSYLRNKQLYEAIANDPLKKLGMQEEDFYKIIQNLKTTLAQSNRGENCQLRQVSIEDQVLEARNFPDHVLEKLKDNLPDNHVFSEFCSQYDLDETHITSLKSKYMKYLIAKHPDKGQFELSVKISSFSPKVLSTQDKLNDSFHRLFCRRCFIYNCPTHLVEVIPTEMRAAKVVKENSKVLVRRGGCGPDCTIVDPILNYNEIPLLALWTIEDINLLSTLARVFNNSPCAIAITLITKSCRLVHATIQKLGIPFNLLVETTLGQEEDLTRREETGASVRRNPSYEFKRDSMPRACAHPGTPCAAVDDCSCKELGIYCGKYCACSDECENKFLGCSCPSMAICDSNSCECVRAFRECDPDFCTGCGADKVNLPPGAGRKCRNMKIQLRKRKSVYFAESDIENAGFGLYAEEKIKAGDFIGEYCGELIGNAEATRRDKLYTKAKLSYLFTLNNEQTVDAFRIGNEMRFINSSTSAITANCLARIIYVNGDCRIAIIARKTINKHEEILMAYEDLLEKHEIAAAAAASKKEEEKNLRKRPATTDSETDDNFEDDGSVVELIYPPKKIRCTKNIQLRQLQVNLVRFPY